MKKPEYLKNNISACNRADSEEVKMVGADDTDYYPKESDKRVILAGTTALPEDYSDDELQFDGETSVMTSLESDDEDEADNRYEIIVKFKSGKEKTFTIIGSFGAACDIAGHYMKEGCRVDVGCSEFEDFYVTDKFGNSFRVIKMPQVVEYKLF